MNIAIIPARSQSKRIKNKNIKKFMGKPIIAWSIEAAKKSKIFDYILVSTDSKRISTIAKKYGAEVPFLRPKNLAQKNTTDLEVITYELKRYEKYFKKKFHYVVCLQPTSPIRKRKDFDKCFKIIKQKKPDALWTVSKIDSKFNPVKQLVFKNDKLKYFSKDGPKFKSRQLLKNTYIRNGVAYFYSRKTILNYKKVLPNNSVYYEIKNKYVNIDNIADLNLAKKLSN